MLTVSLLEGGHGERNSANQPGRHSLGQSALATEYLAGLRCRGRFIALVEEMLGRRDALLLPTIPVVAPERASRVVGLGDGSETGAQMTLTALPGAFNCSGSPVVSVPVGLVGGLPVGASLVDGSAVTMSCSRWPRWSKTPPASPGDPRPCVIEGLLCGWREKSSAHAKVPSMAGQIDA